LSKKDIILYGLIGILLIVNVVSLNRMNSLQEQMQINEDLQNQIQNVEYSVQDITAQLDQKLTEFNQKQQWIQGEKYNVLQSNRKQHTIDVRLKWRLKDLQKGEEVLLLFREYDENQWTELEVTNENGLNYYVNHTFSLDENYETQVVAVSEEGKRSEDLLQLNFYEQMNQRMPTNAFVHQAGNGMFDINVDIENHLVTEFPLTANPEELKITSAKAKLLFNGQVLREINLLKDSEFLQHDNYLETLRYNNMLKLREEIGDEFGKVELHVTVEDGLGFTYETIGHSEK